MPVLEWIRFILGAALIVLGLSQGFSFLPYEYLFLVCKYFCFLSDNGIIIPCPPTFCNRRTDIFTPASCKTTVFMLY